ncbi:MAG: isoprenylcysteine carboxylmethyltransferase family protein [Lachnospiraceae bacterium]|nr:isoprenylcysteine carboxylmethyltransferase family protein [Lachnospiraceae bacterium]
MDKKRLILITYSSVAAFFVMLLLMIFPVAGDWHFRSGWLFWAVFCAPTLLITAYFLKKDPALIERRMLPQETRPQQMIGQSIAGLLFCAIIILPALDHRFTWSHVPFGLSFVGAGLILAGFVLVFLVFRENSFASRAVQLMKDQEVITTGPYALVRHPMYLGAVLVIVATPVALGSWWGLLLSAPLVGVIIFRIRDEEMMLLSGLPGYEAYCRRTRYRLIPFIW